ncbi:uncharacterized protein LOC134609439, partial [Pelobates fuscus]|uniref:uncharacterized protein LOC134609439 n=1 Tax=Pelobates fuscus TaxID=191477 RepID=UPI002FE48228
YMPECPVQLLGRDMLSKLQAQITFLPDGTTSLKFNGPSGIMTLSVPKEEEWRLYTVLTSQNPRSDETLFNIPGVWAENNPPGLARNIPPIKIELKHGVYPVSLRQYHIPQKAKKNIQSYLDKFIRYGILKFCTSPWNTPLLPVQKPGTDEYRPVQDLRAVNDAVVSIHPVVPNPYNLLALIPGGATYFTVLDLKDAFFCLRIAAESQCIFAFQWENAVTGSKRQMTWTRLPQGFKNSPTLFGSALSQDLLDFESIPGECVLLQYVDDLLIAAVTKEKCQQATHDLLHILWKAGYKVSRKKAQLCLPTVKYLGFHISEGQRIMGPERKEAVCQIPIPKNRRQVREFLGAAGFCRIWIPSYAILAKPLYAAIKGTEHDPFLWTQEQQTAFEDVKKALMSAPALGLPDHTRPFYLYVHEQRRMAVGVLTQYLGSWQRPVAYMSKQLDAVASGLPPCLRAVAAAALLVAEADKLTLGQELYVRVPHAVQTLLDYKGNHWFSNSRMTKYQAMLCENPRVHLETVNTLNPATLLPQPTESQHDCLEVMDEVFSSRPDLRDFPIQNPDVQYYTDGSSYVKEGIRYAGYAVTTIDKVIEARPLAKGTSAQKAELIALTRALQLAEGLRVNIYTDSKYAFLTTHAHGALYKERGLLNSEGKEIKYAAEILQLLEAVWEPKEVGIIHCRAHLRGDGDVTKGNRMADSAAKRAADFTVMPKSGGHRYLLVIVCTYSGWVEACPTRTEKAGEVVRFLLREIIPRYGLPCSIGSDNGPAFVHQCLQQLTHMLGIKWRLHTAYRPQSSGKVERMNRTIKNQLAKMCQETQLKWNVLLPIALLRIRSTPTRRMGLSPFEIMYGRPPPVLGNLRGDLSQLGEGITRQQVVELGKTMEEVQKWVQDRLPVNIYPPVHSYHPGDQVWIKEWNTVPLGPKWRGPYVVLLSTPTAIKVAEVTPWIHHSRVKPAAVDSWQVTADPENPCKIRL